MTGLAILWGIDILTAIGLGIAYVTGPKEWGGRR